MIEFKNVDKIFNNKEILHNINLTINSGTLFGIVGPSGEGKTTLLKLINGLLLPDNGEVLIDSYSTKKIDTSKLRLNSGYVPQSSVLFPNLTVSQNITIQLEERHITKKECEQKARLLLKQVGLDEHFLNRKITQLSGGQKQRIALARALATQPNMILFDESFSALDPILREQMQDLILHIHQQNPKLTMVFVTHNMQETIRICDEIAVIKDGIIQQSGTPQTILNHPANSFVSNFFNIKSNLQQLIKQQIAIPSSSSSNAVKICNFNELITAFLHQQKTTLVFKYRHQNYNINIFDLIQFMQKEGE